MIRSVFWSRHALDDLKAQVAYIATKNPMAARWVAEQLHRVGIALGTMATGRPGRVRGTYEKSTAPLPYIVVYRITAEVEMETIVILRIIHTARDWPT